MCIKLGIMLKPLSILMLTKLNQSRVCTSEWVSYHCYKHKEAITSHNFWKKNKKKHVIVMNVIEMNAII